MLSITRHLGRDRHAFASNSIRSAESIRKHMRDATFVLSCVIIGHFIRIMLYLFRSSLTDEVCLRNIISLHCGLFLDLSNLCSRGLWVMIYHTGWYNSHDFVFRGLVLRYPGILSIFSFTIQYNYRYKK